jgi:hypothetical protein
MSIAIEKVRALTDPLKIFQFKMSISPIPKIVTGVNGDELSLRCTATELPGSTVEQSTISLGGYDVRYAGRRLYSGTWPVTIIESMNADMIKFFELWQSLCNDPVLGVQQSSAIYKVNGIIELYTGENTVTHRRRIQGIFPTEVNAIGLDMSSSDAAKLEVSFSYDFYQDIA